MATKGELIDSAYAELGLAGYVFDLTAEERQEGLIRLERMMSGFDASGIRVGYALAGAAAKVGDQTGLPDWAEDAVVPLLAMRIAPTIGKPVSQDTRKAAREGKRLLLMGNYEIPDMQMPRHMPIGLGNRRNTKNQQFFAPVDRLTTTNDATLEPSGNPWPDAT